MPNLTIEAIYPRHIYLLSRWLSALCGLLTVTLPLAVAVYWATADSGTLAVRASLRPDVVDGEPVLWQRLAGAALSEVALILMLIGLWQARRFFQLFSRNQIFNHTAVRCLKHFAGWSAASAAATMAGNVATSVILTANNAPGARYLAIGISSDHLLLLFFAGMVFLMAHVIQQGQQLAEENAGFI